MKIVVLVVLFAFAAAQEQTCPENQEYTTCGSACTPTCDNPKPEMCTMQCVVGCVCKAGYYKDKNGNCIDPKQCPGGTTERCSKPHQKYEECGTACPPSCKTPKPEACTEQCVKGCFCEPGYVLDDQGNCVDPKRCPGSAQKCTKPHEKYSDCGSACPASCATQNQEPQPCIAMCVAGCVCEDGYIRDNQGNCVRPSQCQKCERNERWSNDTCVMPRVCQGPTCPNNQHEIACKVRCIQGGCVCKDGFYRDNQHNCVRLNACNPGATTRRPRPRRKSREAMQA